MRESTLRLGIGELTAYLDGRGLAVEDPAAVAESFRYYLHALGVDALVIDPGPDGGPA